MFLKILFLSLLILVAGVSLCSAQNDASENLFVIWDERGKYGYIDQSGSVRIEPQFDGALPFSEGLAPVSLNKKWGFIDPLGKVIVPLKYRAVSPFSDGLASVRIKIAEPPFPCGYIDRAGKFIIEPQNKFSCRDFHEGFASISIYDEQIGELLDGYINKTGELVRGGRYARAEPFSEGYALVNDFDKTFFIGADGKTIDLRGYGGTDAFSNQYFPTGSFSEGLAAVGIATFSQRGYSRYGFVNRNGKVVFILAENLRAQGAFHNGRALVELNKIEKIKVRRTDGEVITVDEHVSGYGFVDKTGKIIIPTIFSQAENFSENLAAVQIGKLTSSNRKVIVGSAAAEYFNKTGEGRWVCLDLAGKVVIADCGEPLSEKEWNLKFPLFEKNFGRGFVGELFFNKTWIGTGANRQQVFGYMNKTGKYVWIQPHGKNVVPPKFWRELLSLDN